MKHRNYLFTSDPSSGFKYNTDTPFIESTLKAETTHLMQNKKQVSVLQYPFVDKD